MEQQEVVNIEELEKITKCIDENSKQVYYDIMSLSNHTCYRYHEDEKPREILDYINNKPNIIKQGVVDAFKYKHGFSRRVVFKIFQKSEELNLISVKVDPANKRHHHLFVSCIDALASLITVLEYFKKLYFELSIKPNWDF